MYTLKIINTIKNRDDLFVYDDINFASIVRSYMVTVSSSLVDNYFCNGPFDLTSVDMLDT